MKRQIAAVDARDVRQTVARVGGHVVRVVNEHDAAVVVVSRRGGQDAVESEQTLRVLLLLQPLLLGITARLHHAGNCQTLNAASIIRPT